MSQPQDELDPKTLDSETETETERRDENDPDENEETRDRASESENEDEEEDASKADGANGVIPDSGGAKTNPAVVVNLSARRGQSARDEEPYDFDRCTTVITLQIMPPRAEQDTGARKVFLSVRTHSDPPDTTSAQWGDLEPRLPDEIKALLTRVQQDLPKRAAEHAAAKEAERQRQEELKAQAETRAAERKAKGQTKASTARAVKRNKKVDLNAPPALPASKDGVETASANAPGDVALPAPTPGLVPEAQMPANAPSQLGAPTSFTTNPKVPAAPSQMSLF